LNRLSKIILIGCGFLIALRAIASFFPEERLWGVNLLYYLPFVFRWILLILGFLILFPHINKAVGNFLTDFSRRITDKFRKLNRYYKYTFLSLIGGIFFWAFRVKTFLLGDSFLRAREINLGAKLSFTEPLDFFLHVNVAKLFGWDAFQTYAATSIAAGVVFVFFILLVRDLMSKDSGERFIVFSIFFTMGANQLFFGYVESYTLVYVAMIAYILFSWGYIKKNNGLILPILSFFLAVSLHLFAITLFPSLLYLIFSEGSKKTESKNETGTETERRKDRLVKYLISLGIIVLVGIGLFLLQNFNPEKKGLGYYLIYPLGKGESFYSIFSSSHLLDLINHQLLVSPVGMLILLTSILVFRKKIDYKDRMIRFLLWLSIFSLAFAFFIDPKLGYPRDWDMFAFSALGYTFLGVHIFLKSWREAKMGNLRYVTISLLFTSLISTVPWIYVNASEKKSVERFEYLLDLDEIRSAYGRENLAMYYNQRGDSQKEIKQWEKAIKLTGSARYITNLALVYYNQKNYDLALKELERSVKIDSTFDFTHFCLGEIFVKAGKYEEAIAEYRKAIKFRSTITQYYDNLGALLANLKRYQEAVLVFEQGLEANPGYPSIYRNLGYTYYNLNDFSQAEKYLELYLQYAPKAEDASEVQEVLRGVKSRE
jgi:tetratricopeptide (TPR) repeat protein